MLHNRIVFEDARNFAASDWQNLSRASRERLLVSLGIIKLWSPMTWYQLAPTVKEKLIKSLIKEKDDAITQWKIKKSNQQKYS
jgi:hypothetical protein